MPLADISLGGADAEDELGGCTEVVLNNCAGEELSCCAEEDSGITSFGGIAGLP